MPAFRTRSRKPELRETEPSFQTGSQPVVLFVENSWEDIQESEGQRKEAETGSRDVPRCLLVRGAECTVVHADVMRAGESHGKPHAQLDFQRTLAAGEG